MKSITAVLFRLSASVANYHDCLLSLKGDYNKPINCSSYWVKQVGHWGLKFVEIDDLQTHGISSNLQNLDLTFVDMCYLDTKKC